MVPACIIGPICVGPGQDLTSFSTSLWRVTWHCYFRTKKTLLFKLDMLTRNRKKNHMYWTPTPQKNPKKEEKRKESDMTHDKKIRHNIKSRSIFVLSDYVINFSVVSRFDFWLSIYDSCWKKKKKNLKTHSISEEGCSMSLMLSNKSSLSFNIN